MKWSSSQLRAKGFTERDRKLLRIRHGAATLCYGFAWLSMIALIAMVTIAELLVGEAAGGSETLDTDTLARLNMSLRTPR